MVNMSDKIGYIYWFFVLITISCGGVSGIFETVKYQRSMDTACTDRLNEYRRQYPELIVPALELLEQLPEKILFVEEELR